MQVQQNSMFAGREMRESYTSVRGFNTADFNLIHYSFLFIEIKREQTLKASLSLLVNI